jgi:hypothetical protein
VNVQVESVAAKQFDDGEANRIRATGRSRSKYAMRTIVGGRRAEQGEAVGAVKLPENDEMREAFDVGEACLKLGQDPENSIDLVLAPRPLGI